MIPVPNLDDRTHRDLVEEALRLIPQYCPEWTNFNPSDPGVTLIELFAWMTEMAIYRLNKVTDKNFVAFLSMMGVRLQPPQPARTLMRFDLVPKAPPTWVTKGTPVATQAKGKDEPVVFETQDDVLVIDNQIVRCFTQVSDEYADQTPFIDGRRHEGFEVFGGINHIERSLYLGDPRFEQLGEDALLVVRIESAGTMDVVDLLEWEYWNGRRWRELDRSPTQVEDGAVAFAGIDVIEETEVDGVTARWIRGRLVETPPDAHETNIDSIVARVEVLGEGMAPVAAYTNVDAGVYLTVDLLRPFAPFGKEPVADNAFYLLPEALPTLAGSLVRIGVQLAEAKLKDPSQPSEDLRIAWEYFNGKKWKVIGRCTLEGSVSNELFDFHDETEAFTVSGEVRFRMPGDMATTEVNGEDGVWIRARIEDGDYGLAGQYELDGDRWLWRDERPLKPPWLRSVTLRYSELESPTAHVLTYNDFTYFDHSLTARTPLKVFQAFEPSEEDSPTLYLAFEHAFPNDPVCVFFQMSEKTSIEADRRHSEYLSDYYAERDKALAAEQRVVWEYWNGRSWTDLTPQDETRAFTESGFLRFVGPEDLKPSKRFGVAAHWVRARLEMGGYHQMPRVTHILLNAVYAHHQTTITEEQLGSSDGTPNQSFSFARGPLLEGQSILVREREAPTGDELIEVKARQGEDAIREARRGGYWVRWTEVDSLYESTARSRHYVVDRLRGAIKFGDGKKGLIPGAGSANVMAETYRIGGGARGNVTAGMVTALRRTVAHVDTVYNPFPAAGGSDQETVDEAKVRGPHVIKSRNRAVTAEDFEWLTLEASNGIARAKCLNTIGREGEVTVVVVPKQDARRRDLTIKPVPSTELLRRVKHFLDERRLISTKVHVARPRYAEISINVEVIRTNSSSSEGMRKAVDERLRTFLHPLIGGRDNEGWAFGRNVLKLDLYHVIEDVEGVDVVHRIRLHDEDARGDVEHVKVAADQLVHLVDVNIIEKPREQFR